MMQYSSVEEAIETRNALYNIQWPPNNGGRPLVAEFVDRSLRSFFFFLNEFGI